ncbi:MAG: endolytic transglycosylase MltG [Desulfobulbales bacterium]
MTFLGLRLPVLLLIFLAIPFLWLLWLGVYAISPGPPSAAKQIEVLIPSRTGLSAIKKILAENRVIKDDPRFSMLVRLTGAGTKLRAGEYAFEPGQKPLQVIDLLKKGKVLFRPVTIPEGTEMEMVAAILAADGWVDLQRFLDLARAPEILESLGINAESLEGYLFPDTFYLSREQQDEAEIIQMMVARHFQVFNAIVQDTGNDLATLSHHEIITLASIVEAETGNSEERPLVASVFLNRLARGMRLQADPTVRYGLKEDAGPLTQKDLKNPTPYNTYIISGLPPGPITNPGKASIEAVISPAQTDYLYFVAKDESSHHFSRNLEEHNKAVSKYRKSK